MIGKGKYYIVYMYGCQMNEYDFEIIKGFLEFMGYQVIEDCKEVDIILLNICVICENVEDKVFGELGYFKILKMECLGLLFGVCGCMFQEEGVVNWIM